MASWEWIVAALAVLGLFVLGGMMLFRREEFIGELRERGAGRWVATVYIGLAAVAVSLAVTSGTWFVKLFWIVAAILYAWIGWSLFKLDGAQR